MVKIIHRREISAKQDEKAVVWGGGKGIAAVKGISEGKIELLIEGAGLPAEWYRGVMSVLREAGAGRIDLESWGWWLGEEAGKPAFARIVDHVACHLPNPLTGSESARRGEAFVSMRGAYDRVYPIARHAARAGAVVDAVLWHTEESEGMSDEDASAARGAGCVVAGGNVAGWATVAVAAGCRFSAMVEITE